MSRIPSPGAIIKAARASTAAGQGAPGVSPLVSSFDGWNQAYGNYLPRPPQDFTQGAFGPLSPILPVPLDQPPAGFQRAEPRRLPYQVGWNLPVGQPRTEGVTLTDFATLRTLSSLYSVARACIQLLKSEIRGLEWDIVPTKDAAKAMRGDHDAARDFGERRADAIRFFRNPDPEYGSWSSWIDTALEDTYAIDALSVYLRPSRARGRGLLGSDLSAIELIAGETIRPLYDLHGSRPSPPAPAYQQYLWGVPRSDMISIMSGADLTPDMTKTSQYRGDQLLYMPYTRQTISPYGMPPVEQALIPVMAGLSKQGYQLDFFREGSIPGLFISPGDAAMTPSQVRELQDALNVIAGDVGFKHKIIVLPPGSKTEPQKPPQLADQFDAIVSTEVCMAFQVQPTELGLMPQVATVQTPSSVNQVSKANAALHQRKSLIPMLQFLKQALFDRVLQVVCGQHDMQWMWEGLEETEDEVALTNLLIAQVGAGLSSVDEARAELSKDPWGLPVTSDPLWASANGVMLLGSVDPSTGQPAGQPAALPSVGQQMSGAAGGAASPGANEGQVNPNAMAQGHMPGTTHVPPAKPRSQTPAHSAAIAGANAAAQHAAASPAAKAALSELDALARHVRKGRDPASWQAVHIPGHIMALITEDAGKGLDIAEVLTGAQAMLGKARPLSTAEARASQQVDQAFAQVRQQASTLFSQWLGGTLPVSAQQLASMISDLILNALSGALAQIQAGGFAAGYETASGQLGLTAADRQQALALAQADMAQLGRQAAARQIAATGMAALAGALLAALLAAAGTVTAVALLALLGKYLTKARADLIGVTEWQKALASGRDAAYQQAGVGWVRWQTRNDSRVCGKCMANQDLGPRPAGFLWPGTRTTSTPGHPRCRCRLLPAGPPPGNPAAGSVPGSGPPVIKADKPGKHIDQSRPAGEQVYDQLLDDYPSGALTWIKDCEWRGPEEVPLDAIAYRPDDWQAGHEDAKVERFRKKIKHRRAKGKPVKPVVLIDRPDTGRGKDLVVVDGHHRTMAYHELGCPVLAYVGVCDMKTARKAEQTHASQYPVGTPGATEYARGKSAGTPAVAAGIAVRAADTGRVLMLQRAVSEGDPASGRWEFPGGCLDPGEEPFAAACREWAEECGRPLPDGTPGGMWASRDGVYRGYVLIIASEDAVPVHEGRDQVINPDDPDGDQVEALAWWDPSHLPGNPALRMELAGDLDLVLSALAGTALKAQSSAEVLREYWTHQGHPGPTQYALEEKIRWGEPDDWYRCVDELTPYIGSDGAKGYCNLRHHEVLGYWPAQHARMGG